MGKGSVTRAGKSRLSSFGVACLMTEALCLDELRYWREAPDVRVEAKDFRKPPSVERAH